MKPMLLIATAIVAFGSIITRADAIDIKHLFGFTIGTDIGELGGKELERNTLLRLDKRTGSYSALGPKLDIFAATMDWVSTALGAVAFLLVQRYVQIAGRSADDPVPLDFRNFERHQAAFKFGFTF